jgi:hypothetical protein
MSNSENLKDLDKFYKLKQEYDINKKCDKCNKLHEDKIFTIKFNPETNTRQLNAYCKNCDFRMNINLSKIYNLEDVIDGKKKIIEDLQRQIIILKNDVLFEYVSKDAAFAQFDILKEKLDKVIKVNTEYSTLFLNYVPDQNLLETEQTQYYEKIANLKTQLYQFIHNKDNFKKPYIDESIKLYKSIIEIYNKINQLKHIYNEVVYNDDEQTYSFNQQKYKPEIKINNEIFELIQPTIIAKLPQLLTAKAKTKKNVLSKQKNQSTQKKITKLRIEPIDDPIDNAPEEAHNEKQDETLLQNKIIIKSKFLYEKQNEKQDETLLQNKIIIKSKFLDEKQNEKQNDAQNEKQDEPDFNTNLLKDKIIVKSKILQKI